MNLSARFQRMNARTERTIEQRRHEMIRRCIAGHKSGFVCQIKTGGMFSDIAACTVRLRNPCPRPR
jgi:hypothetical protein